MNLTPRVKTALSAAMESHAIWCHTGNTNPGSTSLLARLMESKGHFNFGSKSGPKNGPTNSLPERIESALMKLAAVDLLAVDCVRLTYGAGALNVCKRRRLPKSFRWHDSTQETRADALGICVRTFRNKTNKALEFILAEVTK